MRGVLTDALARSGDLGKHGVEDEGAAFLGLLESLAQNLEREAGGLVVHLHGGDALGGTRHLEVHVAEEVLETLDVGENDGLAVLLDEAHGDTGNRALQGHATVHEGKAAAAGRRHGRGAVGLHDLGDDADGVGELFLGRNDGQKGALSQGAVADLAALGRTHAAGLTGAVRREVVLVDVALAIDGLDGVEALPVVEHAKRQHREDLGLTALEEAGAVHEGQVAGLDHERTDLVGTTAVNALSGLDDHDAHGVLLEALELNGDLAVELGLLLLGELGLDSALELVDLGHTGLLVGILEGGAHLVVVGEDLVVHVGVRLVERVLLHDDGAIDLGDLLEEDLLLVAERTEGLLAELHGGQHVLLGDLLGAGLEHAHEVAGAAELEVEVGVVALFVGGVDDELMGVAVAADAHAGQRALEGHAAHGEGSGGTHGADDVEGVDLVAHERGGNDLHLVAEAVGEARTDGAVDHAGSEGRLVGGAGLTLEVATGQAADRVHALHEVNRQREEVVVLALLGDDGGHEDRGVALLDQDGARRLLREFASLEGVMLAIEVELVCNLCHSAISFNSARPIASGTYAPAPRLSSLMWTQNEKGR